MEPINNTDSKNKRTAFVVSMAFATLLLGVLIVFLFVNGNTTNKKNAIVPQPVTTNTIAAQNEKEPLQDVLRQRLTDLRNLSNNYTAAFADKGNKAVLDSLEKLVIIGEQAFQASIDSVWINAVAGRKIENSQLDDLNAYRKSLDSIKSLNKGDNTTADDKNFVPDREAFIRLRNELMEKTNKIALLESSIEVMSRQAATDGAGPSADKINDTENTNVVLLENKVNELTTDNQRMLQEIDRLKRQPLEASKNNSTEQQILLSKNTALQQKVNAINAELQLVRVDCNLSRVDATQIISNSKQRKQLLSEASSILTDLSASGDADIRSKVKEKIVRLNQVAANTRD